MKRLTRLLLAAAVTAALLPTAQATSFDEEDSDQMVVWDDEDWFDDWLDNLMPAF